VSCVFLFAGLLPNDPNVIVGQNLNMTCQLYSDQYHARDLRFEFHPYHERKKNSSEVLRKKRVRASDTHIINDSVVELYYTNVRSRYDRAMVVCYHRNDRDIHASQIIKVGCE